MSTLDPADLAALVGFLMVAVYIPWAWWQLYGRPQRADRHHDQQPSKRNDDIQHLRAAGPAVDASDAHHDRAGHSDRGHADANQEQPRHLLVTYTEVALGDECDEQRRDHLREHSALVGAEFHRRSVGPEAGERR